MGSLQVLPSSSVGQGSCIHLSVEGLHFGAFSQKEVEGEGLFEWSPRRWRAARAKRRRLPSARDETAHFAALFCSGGVLILTPLLLLIQQHDCSGLARNRDGAQRPLAAVRRPRCGTNARLRGAARHEGAGSRRRQGGLDLPRWRVARRGALSPSPSNLRGRLDPELGNRKQTICLGGAFSFSLFQSYLMSSPESPLKGSSSTVISAVGTILLAMLYFSSPLVRPWLARRPDLGHSSFERF